METAMGVFSSRDSAEDGVKELLQRGVPEASLVFLTRSESKAKQFQVRSQGNKYSKGFS